MRPPPWGVDRDHSEAGDAALARSIVSNRIHSARAAEAANPKASGTVVNLLKKLFASTSEDSSNRLESVSSNGAVRNAKLPPEVVRKSTALGHFFENFPSRSSGEVLDLGGLNESNVEFLSRKGYRIHALDLLPVFDRVKVSLPDRRFDGPVARGFVDEYFRFRPNQFDAILAWNTLEQLDADLLALTIRRLGEILSPGGSLLTIFHTQSRGETVSVYKYLIEGSDALRLQTRQLRALPQSFNNRSLENLFSDYHSVKFFLARDSLREVIAVR